MGRGKWGRRLVYTVVTLLNFPIQAHAFFTNKIMNNIVTVFALKPFYFILRSCSLDVNGVVNIELVLMWPASFRGL